MDASNLSLTPSTTFGPSDLEVVNDEQAYRGFFKVRRLKLRHPTFDGGHIEVVRERLDRGMAAAIVLYDPDKDAVVMIEQVRVGAMRWLLESPAGMIDGSEDSTAAIVRETEEETGREIRKLISICTYYPSPGGCSETIHLFCGLVDSDGAEGLVYGNPHEGEDIKLRVIPFDDAYQGIFDGAICDAASVAGLFWLKANRNELAAPSNA